MHVYGKEGKKEEGKVREKGDTGDCRRQKAATAADVCV